MFFQYSSFSGVKKAMFLRKCFYWIMSFCGPHIEEIPKSASRIDIPLSCNSLFSKNTRLNSFIQVSIRNVLHVKQYYSKQSVVCVLRHNPHSLKILKSAIILDISRYSNWLLAAITDLIWSIKVTIESFNLFEEDSIEKQLILILASKFWWSKTSRKNVGIKISFQLSKWCFSVTIGLISSTRVTINNFEFPGKG